MDALAGPWPLQEGYITYNTKFGILRLQQFEWGGAGYSLVARYFPAAAAPLDEEFSVIYELTYHTFGGNDGVDTSPFRTGVWHYATRLYGVMNDEFDYKLVNQFVHRDIKGFLKNVTCFPEIVEREAYATFMPALGDDEKIHAILLCVEARKQVELLYALRAISREFA